MPTSQSLGHLSAVCNCPPLRMSCLTVVEKAALRGAMRINRLLTVLLCLLMMGGINAQLHRPSSGAPASVRDQTRGDQTRTDTVYEDEWIWIEREVKSGKRASGQDAWENRMSRTHGIEVKEPQQEVEMKGRLKLRRGLTQKMAAMSEKIGSRPPACGKAKCKGCTPCTPVQVTVPPAQHTLPAATSGSGDGIHSSAISYHMDSPYYSVAWKCRCKGNLFSP